jgi:hypothetical protein
MRFISFSYYKYLIIKACHNFFLFDKSLCYDMMYVFNNYNLNIIIFIYLGVEMGLNLFYN